MNVYVKDCPRAAVSLRNEDVEGLFIYYIKIFNYRDWMYIRSLSNENLCMG